MGVRGDFPASDNRREIAIFLPQSGRKRRRIAETLKSDSMFTSIYILLIAVAAIHLALIVRGQTRRFGPSITASEHPGG